MNDSLANCSDHLMDLSLKTLWVITHFPESDPGSEFEIVNSKDVVSHFGQVIKKGTTVTVTYGAASVQGIVVTVSDDYEYLSKNLKTIVDDYMEEIKDILALKKSKHNGQKKNTVVQATKETQTDHVSEKTSKEYMQLKRKFDQLQYRYTTLKSIVTNVKNEIEESTAKLDDFQENTVNNNDKNKTAPLQQKDENICKENSNKMVQIGPGGTKVPHHIFASIKWESHTAATRKLLMTLFPRKVLATHSLSGKPSPAFVSTNKVTKMRLNPTIISDIVEIVVKKCKVLETMVRVAITTKCADENKMYKKRLERRQQNENEIETKKRLRLLPQ